MNRCCGFTLVELFVVIVIFGFMMALGRPCVFHLAKETQC